MGAIIFLGGFLHIYMSVSLSIGAPLCDGSCDHRDRSYGDHRDGSYGDKCVFAFLILI